MHSNTARAALHSLAIVGFASGILQAQGDRAAELVIEQTSSYRWLHGAQIARFTPHVVTTEALHVVSRERDASTGNTTWRIGFGSLTGSATGVLVTSVEGAVLDAQAATPARAFRMITRPVTDTGADMSQVVEGPGTSWSTPSLRLPVSRLWNVVPRVPVAALRTGFRWADTLNLAANERGYIQRISGPRTSTVVGDTLLEGKRLWIIQETARVEFHETLYAWDYSLRAYLTLRRTASGSGSGRYLFDPDSRLYAERSDTLFLSGTGELTYPDGSTFTTPVRLEQTQVIRTMTGAEYAQAREARRSTRSNLPALLAGFSDEQRAAMERGDTAMRDSLYSTWDASASAEERLRLRLLLRRWDSDTVFKARRAARGLEVGDTAAFMLDLLGGPESVKLWDSALLYGLLIPQAGDRQAAFDHGYSREQFIETAHFMMLNSIPALTADTSRWYLSPSTYDMFAQLWTNQTDPQIRSIGLLAHFARDPVGWADTVLAAELSSPMVLETASQLIRGVGARWPVASKQPMPAVGADWRTWLEWMGGRSADYPVIQVGDTPPQKYPIVRFDGDHADAIRIHQMVTGRRIVEQLHAGLDAAIEDSAVLVFATMLRGLNELPAASPRLAQQLRDGSEPLRTFGERAFPALFREVPDTLKNVALSPDDSLALYSAVYTVALTNGTQTAHTAPMHELVCVRGLESESALGKAIIQLLQRDRTFLVREEGGCKTESLRYAPRNTSLVVDTLTGKRGISVGASNLVFLSDGTVNFSTSYYQHGLSAGGWACTARRRQSGGWEVTSCKLMWIS